MLKKLDRERLRSIHDYLKESIGKEPAKAITIDALAYEFAINKNKIKSGFKELYGVGPREFQLNLQIDYAKSLLRENEKSIKEIAFALGYSNSSNFGVTFKKITKRTPVQYRNESVKNENED